MNSADLFAIASFIVNGIFLVLFLGVLLSAARSLLSKGESKEEAEEQNEVKVPQKLISGTVAPIRS